MKAKLHLRDPHLSGAAEDVTMCGRSWPVGLVPFAEDDADCTCATCNRAWRKYGKRAYVVSIGTRMFGVVAFSPIEAVSVVEKRCKLHGVEANRARVRDATPDDADLLSAEIEQLAMVAIDDNGPSRLRVGSWSDVARRQEAKR